MGHGRYTGSINVFSTMGLLPKLHSSVTVSIMRDDFFNLPIEQRDIMLISKRAIARIELRITACEECDPEAEIPLDWILDKITGHQGSTTDYLLERPAHCQCCGREVTEKTSVDWGGVVR